MNRWFKWLLLLALSLLTAGAGAHELSMAEMQVRELAPGEFVWQWTASEKRAPAEVMKPVWPAGCEAEQNVLHCGASGLKGTLSMEGVGTH